MLACHWPRPATSICGAIAGQGDKATGSFTLDHAHVVVMECMSQMHLESRLPMKLDFVGASHQGWVLIHGVHHGLVGWRLMSYFMGMFVDMPQF